MNHHLFRVSADALADPRVPPEGVARTVVDLGDLGYASDGLEMDSDGRLYLTDYENHAIHRWSPEGDEVLVADPRLIWPEALSLSPDGYLYVTVNQKSRLARFHEGVDRRKAPYALFRIRVDATPTTLRR